MKKISTSNKAKVSTMVSLEKDYRHSSDRALNTALMKVIREKFPQHASKIEIIGTDFDGTGRGFGFVEYFWNIDCEVPMEIATDDFWYNDEED